MISGTWSILKFFVASLQARNFIPTIKFLAISKTAKLEFFSRFSGAKRYGLAVFRVTCSVAKFFLSGLHARNCFPKIKFLSISKTTKLEFFRNFLVQKGVGGDIPRYLQLCQIFVAGLHATLKKFGTAVVLTIRETVGERYTAIRYRGVSAAFTVRLPWPCEQHVA